MSASKYGSVRIVGGTCRRRRLEVPCSGEVRPTSEMVREAIFDVLGPVNGLRVLDMFAGSGAMGLESLSRGASGCVFVEKDGGTASVLKKNIRALGYESASRVVVADYMRAVSLLERGGESFDLLFVDPPYRMLAEVETALSSMVPRILAPEGVMVVEGPRSLSVTFGQALIFERQYGDTKVSMIKLKE